MISLLLKRHFLLYRNRGTVIFLAFLAILYGLSLLKQNPGVVSLYIVIYVFVNLGILLGLSKSRASVFDITLPIPAMDLLLFRSLIAGIYIWVPAILFVVGTLYICPDSRSQLAPLFLEIALLATAAASVCLSYRMQYARLEGNRLGSVIFSCTLLLFLCLLFSRLSSTEGEWLDRLLLWMEPLLCLGVTISCWRKLIKRLPAGYLVGERTSAKERSSLVLNTPDWWPMFRAVHDLSSLIFIIIPLSLVIGARFIVLFVLFSRTTSFISKLGWLLPLPVARWKLFLLDQAALFLSLSFFLLYAHDKPSFAKTILFSIELVLIAYYLILSLHCFVLWLMRLLPVLGQTMHFLLCILFSSLMWLQIDFRHSRFGGPYSSLSMKHLGLLSGGVTLGLGLLALWSFSRVEVPTASYQGKAKL